MDFNDQWREEVATSLAEAAKLAVQVKSIDLEYALMTAAVLWPLRQPVQNFDVAAIMVVNQLLGPQAKPVLQVVQQWDGDLMAAAQDLNNRLVSLPELDSAINVLIKKFKAFFIFADEVSKLKTTLETVPPSAEVETVVVTSPPHVEIPAVAPEQPARVFISYARSDGEELARVEAHARNLGYVRRVVSYVRVGNEDG